jgi:Iron/manganese superoxide dismutases, C-terminal domain
MSSLTTSIWCWESFQTCYFAPKRLRSQCPGALYAPLNYVAWPDRQYSSESLCVPLRVRCTEGVFSAAYFSARFLAKWDTAFEYNGMVLHEYYFGNMTKNGSTDPGKQCQFYHAAQGGFGSYDIWKADFVSIGKMRGVGWAICFQDPKRRRLTNQWVTLHEMGNIAGFEPVLVMDVWEHAFLLDYKPAERPNKLKRFSQTLTGV